MIVRDGLIFQKPKSEEVENELLWHLRSGLNLDLFETERKLATLNNSEILFKHIGKGTLYS